MEQFMRKFIIFSVLMVFFGCQNLIDKPKNLLSEKQMAEILADFALNDQTSTYNPSGNLEIGTRYILKKYKVTPEDFSNSYKYYIVEKKITNIVNLSQDIIKEKHPEAGVYIENKEKENKKLPPISR
jgi:hypothetical protein